MGCRIDEISICHGNTFSLYKNAAVRKSAKYAD